MSFNLWLSQPETERQLSACLRTVMAVVILWALAAAYSLWSAQSALAAVQADVLSHNRQLAQAAQGLPEKRRLAGLADSVKLIDSNAGGSADITVALAGLAQGAGAEIGGIRIGDAAQQASPQTGPATSASGGWNQETFECTLTGEYDSLTRFLNGLADSPYLIDISSLQILHVDAGAHSTAPRLEMKLSGAVYESSDNS